MNRPEKIIKELLRNPRMVWDKRIVMESDKVVKKVKVRK